MFNINLLNPDFIIDCNTLMDYSDVYQKFRDNGITKAYVYAMGYKTGPFSYDFLKVGLSHPDLKDRDYQVGERVCRQVSHLPGWMSITISDHGNDFYRGVKRLQAANELPKTFTKDEVVVGVWDVSKRIPTLNGVVLHKEKHATEWAEGELCNQYKKIHGDKPKLNYRDPSNSKVYKNGYTLSSVASMFEGLY
jgi:hypothetical protein